VMVIGMVVVGSGCMVGRIWLLGLISEGGTSDR
jgi:hypothetical protein